MPGCVCGAFLRPSHGSAIRTPQLIEFLEVLHATIRRKLTIIRVPLQAHHCKPVRLRIEAQPGANAREISPAYAPEANPVECIWNRLKDHAVPTCGTRVLGDPAHRARRGEQSVRCGPTLATARRRRAKSF
jgi:hypothetical protein